MNKFIGHIDTLLNYDQDKSYDFFTNNDNFHVDLVKMKKAGIKLAVFAVYVESKYKPFWALERTLELIDRFHNLIESSQELQLIKDLEDIESLLENDKIGA